MRTTTVCSPRLLRDAHRHLILELTAILIELRGKGRLTWTNQVEHLMKLPHHIRQYGHVPNHNPLSCRPD